MQNKIVIKFQALIVCNIIQYVFMNVLSSRLKKDVMRKNLYIEL